MEEQAEIMSESGSLSHTAVSVNEHARRCVNLALALAREETESVRTLIDEETREEEAEGSPLWVACQVGSLSVLPQLWRTSPKHSRIRSLYAAVQSDNLEIVKIILELSKTEGSTFSKKLAFSPDEDGNNPLHIAAKKGNSRIMAKLLEEFPELILTVNKQRRNVLHIGVENRQMDVVKYLLEQREWKYLARASDKNSETFLHHGNQLTLEDIEELLAIFRRKTGPTAGPTANNLIEKIGNLHLEKLNDITIEDIKRSREWISVTATLLATMSYQGVLGSITASGADAKDGPALRDNKHFKNFVLCNSIALSLSLLVLASLTILTAISTICHPFHAYKNRDREGLFIRRVSMHYLNSAILVGVLCIFSSYAQGLKALSLYDKNVLISAIVSSVWMIDKAFILLFGKIFSYFKHIKTFKLEIPGPKIAILCTFCAQLLPAIALVFLMLFP